MAAVAQTIAQVLTSNGFSKAGVAGVLGNLQQESSLNPSESGGGLAQWQGSRYTALQNFASSQGKSVNDPVVQASFLANEIKSQYPGLYNTLRTTSDPRAAALAVSQQYERPGVPMNQNRMNYASNAFQSLGNLPGVPGGSAPAPSPGSVNSVLPITEQVFNKAGFDAAQAKFIAGRAVSESLGSSNPFNVSPGGTRGFASSLGPTSASQSPLFGKGLLTTTAPNQADYETTKTINVAQNALQQLAPGLPLAPHPQAGTTLTGIKTSPGPVANTVVPQASWNPSGKPIATWIVPVLEWAAAHGWQGSVNSGYRSLQQQQSINASGAFSAPAGKSNHEFATYPGGAVDVTDPSQLIQVLKGYTGPQKLVGGVLGPVDPEHFSANGH